MKKSLFLLALLLITSQPVIAQVSNTYTLSPYPANGQIYQAQDVSVSPGAEIVRYRPADPQPQLPVNMPPIAVKCPACGATSMIVVQANPVTKKNTFSQMKNWFGLK